MMDQFLLHRLLLLHYTSFAHTSKIKKMGHKPSGVQIIKSHKITDFINYNALAGFVQEMEIVSVDQMLLRHLFFANSIFNFIIGNY